MLLSFAVSIFYLPNDFAWILFIYLVITTLYSMYLKKIVIADIITLAVLYSIRIVAGGEITKLPLSKWFIAFSLFIFFSLAIIKRYTELKNLVKQNKTKAKGRGYETDDIKLLLTLGTSSGYLSVLIFLLYIFSPEVAVLYHNPLWLIPVSILLLAWITRMWFKAFRGEMDEDPVVYTVKDPFSYVLFGLMILFIVGAML
jgi:4-hydroxybenzoate polyprenyltransferase